jgi:hypothetical protein
MKLNDISQDQQLPKPVAFGDGLADDFNCTAPPKNVFNIHNICPSCGGLGFTRGPGGIYDYRDCPNPKCKGGKCEDGDV